MTTPKPPKQLKQRYYYYFWSIATLAVVFGQIYVAISYRGLTDALYKTLIPSWIFNIILWSQVSTYPGRKFPQATLKNRNKDVFISVINSINQ